MFFFFILHRIHAVFHIYELSEEASVQQTLKRKESSDNLIRSCSGPVESLRSPAGPGGTRQARGLVLRSPEVHDVSVSSSRRPR